MITVAEQREALEKLDPEMVVLIAGADFFTYAEATLPIVRRVTQHGEQDPVEFDDLDARSETMTTRPLGVPSVVGRCEAAFIGTAYTFVR